MDSGFLWRRERWDACVLRGVALDLRLEYVPKAVQRQPQFVAEVCVIAYGNDDTNIWMRGGGEPVDVPSGFLHLAPSSLIAVGSFGRRWTQLPMLLDLAQSYSRPDFGSMPEQVREEMTFHLAETIDDVLALALESTAEAEPDSAAA